MDKEYELSIFVNKVQKTSFISLGIYQFKIIKIVFLFNQII